MLTLVKVKKFQDCDRLIRLYTAITLQQRDFSKITTIVYQKNSPAFYCCIHQQAKRSILKDYEVTDTQTDGQADTYIHTHANGLL